MNDRDTVFHPDEHRTDIFEVEDREEESVDYLAFFKSYAIEHKCDNTLCGTRANHEDGLLEIPSIIFIEAASMVMMEDLTCTYPPT